MTIQYFRIALVTAAQQLIQSVTEVMTDYYLGTLMITRIEEIHYSFCHLSLNPIVALNLLHHQCMPMLI